MSTAALSTFLISLCLLVVWTVVVQLEQRQGKRFILKRFRRWCDSLIIGLYRRLAESWSHFVRYVVQLGWYYSIHSLLRASLNVLVRMYEFIETKFENNRKKAKVLRAEMKLKFSPNQLGQVAEHKAKVALSPEEQARIRHETLEDTH